MDKKLYYQIPGVILFLFTISSFINFLQYSANQIEVPTIMWVAEIIMIILFLFLAIFLFLGRMWAKVAGLILFIFSIGADIYTVYYTYLLIKVFPILNWEFYLSSIFNLFSIVLIFLSLRAKKEVEIKNQPEKKKRKA